MTRKTIALAVIAIFCVIAVLIWRDGSSKRTLPDGTVLVLSGVKVGRTNTYSHGTLISKLLGSIAPSNSIRVAGVVLERPRLVSMPAPEGSELLTAELRLDAGPSREKVLTSPFYRKYRWLISGDADDGSAFVKEFNDFKQQPDGMFSLVFEKTDKGWKIVVDHTTG